MIVILNCYDKSEGPLASGCKQISGWELAVEHKLSILLKYTLYFSQSDSISLLVQYLFSSTLIHELHQSQILIKPLQLGRTHTIHFTPNYLKSCLPFKQLLSALLKNHAPYDTSLQANLTCGFGEVEPWGGATSTFSFSATSVVPTFFFA